MGIVKFSAVGLLSALAVSGGVAFAEMQDRPAGFKIGQRLTLKPYVSMEYTYDSNANQQNDAESDSSWYINPKLLAEYRGDNLKFDLGGFYGYRGYAKNVRNGSEHNYGENLNLAWSNAGENEKGWSILLTERFQKVNAADDIRSDNGNGLWRDRRDFQVDGVIQRRFNENWHASINGGYYYLDYDNDAEGYAPLYGWQRLMAGLELGYAASRWTDIILAAGYQSYTQDNSDDVLGRSYYTGSHDNYERESDGFTVQGGLQTFATDRISYRILAGWSRFEYAGESTDDGFTYSITADWKISDTWTTMLLAQSYYQPSERDYGSANRVDSVSWGLAHTMIRGKLNAVLDLAYRRETRQHTDVSSYDYDEDIFSARLGLDYTINRYLAIYARGEYQGAFFDGDIEGAERDYNRFRLSVGFRLQY